MTPAVAQRQLEEALADYEQKIRRAIGADIIGLSSGQDLANLQLTAARDAVVFALMQAAQAGVQVGWAAERSRDTPHAPEAYAP